MLILPHAIQPTLIFSENILLIQLDKRRKRRRIQVEKILEHIIGIDVFHHVGGD